MREFLFIEFNTEVIRIVEEIESIRRKLGCSSQNATVDRN
jgi:hypothetical protein